MDFSKAPGADWTLPENQDRITDNVWITRADLQGIFNIRTEESFDFPTPVIDSISPLGTEWAFGTTADIGSLTFTPWTATISQNPPNMIGLPMVLHLTDDNIYLDLMFTEWGQGASAGGSFAYTRSTAIPIPEPSTAAMLVGLTCLGWQLALRGRKDNTKT